MIPVELKLKNFISYGPDAPPIQFECFNIACLTGDNGNGKSALLDAITWAVWGQARGTDERGAGADDLVRSGANDMEVEFTFLLEGNKYRICRRRDKRRKKSSLEFQIFDGNTFRSITADSINDTQKKINQVLRMDYHTFTSSSFILQGKADTFTSMKPSERKKILGEILGLSVYRDLEALAREEANANNSTCREIDAKMEGIQEELALQEQYKLEKQELEKKCQNLYQQLEKEQTFFEQLRSSLSELQQVQDKVLELQHQQEEQQKQINATKKRIKDIKAQVKQGEELTSRAEEIESNYCKLQELYNQDSLYNEKSRRLLKLNDEKRDLEKKVQNERLEIEKKCSQIHSEMKHFQKISSEKTVLIRKLAELENKLINLKHYEKRQQELNEAVQRYTGDIREREFLIKKVNEQLSELREKYAVLRQPAARCPLCRTELTGEDREKVLNEMMEEGQMLKDEHKKLQQQVLDLNKKRQQAENELKIIEKRLAEYTAAEKEYPVIKHRLNEIKQAEKKQEELKLQLDKVMNDLKKENYALEEQKAIKNINMQIQELGYCPEKHNEIQRQVSFLKKYEQEYSQLQAVRATIESNKENLTYYEETLASLEKTAQSTNSLIEQYKGRLKELDSIEREYKKAEQKLNSMREEVSEIERRLGILQEKLDRCRRLEQEKQKLTSKKERALKEKKYYEELAKSFGKNGIQAIIIENAIPELEQEANRILQQISDGRLTVMLRTQKPTRNSKKVIETLDIYISDETSTRRYEMFSGGEAFKVNFALRIALSRLLARRAGARLQTLVIDEGFGTQDSKGKEKLVQSINAIAKDFEKIIVITHIEELKHAFPVHVVVTKGENGSAVEVRQ